MKIKTFSMLVFVFFTTLYGAENDIDSFAPIPLVTIKKIESGFQKFTFGYGANDRPSPALLKSLQLQDYLFVAKISVAPGEDYYYSFSDNDDLEPIYLSAQGIHAGDVDNLHMCNSNGNDLVSMFFYKNPKSSMWQYVRHVCVGCTAE